MSKEQLKERLKAFFLRIGSAYVKFRTSAGFLWTILCFVVFWMTFHWVFGFDKDLGGYNSILSTEASIVLTLVQRMVEKQTEFQIKLLKYIAHQNEAILEIARSLKNQETP